MPVDPEVLALATERAGYLRANKADRVIPVDEQLALRGYCVDANGELVPVDTVTRKRKAAQAPVKETRPVHGAPERAVKD